MANLKVTLVRSVIGRPQNQRDIVKGLGLGRVNSSVVVRQCCYAWCDPQDQSFSGR